MTPETYMPVVYIVLGGLASLLGVWICLLTAVPHPRRFGFDVEREADELHRRLSAPLSGRD